MKLIRFTLIVTALFNLCSCEKEITVDLPAVEKKIVVEGSILPGETPLVILTWTQGYFEPTDPASLQNIFVHDAQVTITENGIPHTLDEICLSELPENLSPEALESISTFLGINIQTIQALNLCIYTQLPGSITLRGAPNTTYKIEVHKDNYHITGATKIPSLVELDTVYFDILNPEFQDSLGVLFGNLTDPDTTGNAYRWFAKRINRYPDNVPDVNLRGKQKDLTFIAPFGSVYDDSFFNGLSFEFAYPRGIEANSTKFDDLNDERAFFKVGDTVAIRGCTIDRAAFKFIRSMEAQVSNQGSPFAVPFNLESNLTGGLGAFIGYGAVYDTVICTR
ncbi:MAG: hypothetical protein RL040_103 [Bacteroidota bacterium]